MYFGVFQTMTLMPKTSMSWKSVWIYLKSQIEFNSEIFLSFLKIYFKHRPGGAVQCACIQNNHMINLTTCTWHHSAGSMYEINFQTG